MPIINDIKLPKYYSSSPSYAIDNSKEFTSSIIGQSIKQKNEETALSEQLQNRYRDLNNPGSSYYMNIGKQIRNKLTGALSPNSLFGLTMAMGGSPSQAMEQIKATQNKIGDTTSNLMNEYYLNASGQSNSLLGMMMQNQQFNKNFGLQAEELELKKQMYEDSQDDWFGNLIGSIVGTAGGMAGGNLLSSWLSPKTKISNWPTFPNSMDMR